MRNLFRFFAICAVMMISSMSLNARSLHGIRVEADKGNIIVYVDGVQVCSPVRSCFIANLRADYYRLEVYEASKKDYGYESHRGRLLYNERIYYKGKGVEYVYIRKNGNHGQHGRPDYPGPGGYDVRVIPSGVFNDFWRAVKSEPFYSGQERLIVQALSNYLFTSKQCRRIVHEISFDNHKVKAMMLMYPNIVDKQNFFLVLEELAFSSSRQEMHRFLQGYVDRNDPGRYYNYRHDDDDYDDDYDDDDYDEDDDD